MKTLVIITIVLLGLSLSQASAHSSEELSESAQIIRMFEKDLGAELQRARTLYNALHSESVPFDKKCSYTAELKKTITQFDLGVEQYQQLLYSYINTSFDPYMNASTAMVKLVVLDHVRHESRSMKSVIPILSRNYCQ